MRIPVFTYRPSSAFLSVIKSRNLPSKIIRIHLQEYKKRKTAYKRFFCGYFLVLALLIARALISPGQTTVPVLLFAILAGCIFLYPLFTRIQACREIISVIKESYPEL